MTIGYVLFGHETSITEASLIHIVLGACGRVTRIVQDGKFRTNSVKRLLNSGRVWDVLRTILTNKSSQSEFVLVTDGAALRDHTSLRMQKVVPIRDR